MESAINTQNPGAAPLPPVAEEPAAEYLITVSIAALQVSDDPAAVLVTYALGSCIGVTIYDRELHVGALMHVMLPSSQANLDGSFARPAMFVDTGLPLLLGRMLQLECQPQNLVVKIAGGGQLLSASRQLALGKRNIEAVRVACETHGLVISGEDVGGTRSRNLMLYVGGGRVVVSSCGKEREL